MTTGRNSGTSKNQTSTEKKKLAEFVTPDVTQKPRGHPYVTLSMSIVRTSSTVAVDYTDHCNHSPDEARQKYKEMEKQTGVLPKAVARKPHEMAVAFMYNGFDSVKSSDGQPWFSNSHPLKNAPTKYDDNLITDALGPQGC